MLKYNENLLVAGFSRRPSMPPYFMSLGWRPVNGGKTRSMLIPKNIFQMVLPTTIEKFVSIEMHTLTLR